MDSRDLSRALNQLIHAEKRSLIPRLAEAAAFVSYASADQADTMAKMAEEEREHVAWLTGLINDLGESPTPGTADISTTSMHYVELGYLLPRAIQDKQNLIQFYEDFASQLSSSFDVPVVVNRIIDRHKAHLATLQEMSSGPAPIRS